MTGFGSEQNNYWPALPRFLPCLLALLPVFSSSSSMTSEECFRRKHNIVCLKQPKKPIRLNPSFKILLSILIQRCKNGHYPDTLQISKPGLLGKRSICFVACFFISPLALANPAPILCKKAEPLLNKPNAALAKESCHF